MMMYAKKTYRIIYHVALLPVVVIYSIAIGIVSQPSIITTASAAPQQQGYDISLSFVGVPVSDKDIFHKAARRWESIITGDLPNVARTRLRQRVSSKCVVPSNIDDLYICVQYNKIDGLYGIIGSAFVHETRWSYLAITGEIEFDTADVKSMKSRGIFISAILHEMGHVLGVGTLWDETGATDGTDGRCPYQGELAKAEYKKLSDCGQLPTELDGGSGTRCGHWDEDCLGNELMTGFIDSGNNPISRVTIATLDDIGYTVNYTRADRFTVNDLNPRCRCNNNRRTLADLVHGSTRQLGLRTRSVGNRRLSEERRKAAITYGQQKLRERKEEQERFMIDDSNSTLTSPLDLNQEEEIRVIDAVSVFVVEDGRVYDVVVRSDKK